MEALPLPSYPRAARTTLKSAQAAELAAATETQSLGRAASNRHPHGAARSALRPTPPESNGYGAMARAVADTWTTHHHEIIECLGVEETTTWTMSWTFENHQLTVD